MLYNLKRLTGYALGFVLFYAPVALFQRCLFYLLYGSWQPQSIHGLCFRIPIEHILDGIIWRLTPISMLSTLLLLAVAFFLGPVFCGRLCPAGAFTEYLSKLVPSKFQISWHRYTEIAPIRYGMLAGFCLVPFFGGILACSYCNFFLFGHTNLALYAHAHRLSFSVTAEDKQVETGFFGLFPETYCKLSIFDLHLSNQPKEHKRF